MKDLPKLPLVNKGDAITADGMNAIIERVNETGATEATQEPRARRRARGEFWIVNETGEPIPAFSFVGLRGFATSWATSSAAKTALANDEIVLKTTSPTVSNPNNFGFALEGIRPGGLGRASCAFGALLFGEVAGTTAPSWNARFKLSRSGETRGKFEIDASGEYINVAYDAASRFIAVAPFPLPPTQYEAGHGVNITGSTISTYPTLHWGTWTGSTYSDNAIDCIGTDRLRFGAQFESGERLDGLSGREIRIKAASEKSVLTDATIWAEYQPWHDVLGQQHDGPEFVKNVRLEETSPGVYALVVEKDVVPAPNVGVNFTRTSIKGLQ